MFISSKHISVFTIFIIMLSSEASKSNEDPISEYLQERQKILTEEKELFLGGNSTLTTKEQQVNKMLLEIKAQELLEGYGNSSKFLPSQPFPKAKPLIESSKVFSVIQKLPKGSSLHTHMLAAVSVDYIINNITYRPGVYGCFLNETFKLRFLENPAEDTRCQWKALVDYRKDNPQFDDWLRGQLTVSHGDTPSEVWGKFKKTFTSLYELLCYRPVFQEYIVELLSELYQDNVFYTELKGTFMPLYELNGTVYNPREFFEFFQEAIRDFQATHPKFQGCKYIHSVYRGVANTILEAALKDILDLQKAFPDLIAGFDFVGYEEEGNTLLDYLPQLLPYKNKLNFFFHAGETNWFGHTDLNLVDAILLNSTRIGHAFALSKHPVLMNMVKTRRIAVEVCPISNQVLLLNDDPRNHPAASLMANGVPVVIGNDDPGVWGASGLSYDWYIVFMAMTPKEAGLGVLKEFAKNSIEFSAMDVAAKERAMEVWKGEWEEFLDEMLKG